MKDLERVKSGLLNIAKAGVVQLRGGTPPHCISSNPTPSVQEQLETCLMRMSAAPLQAFKAGDPTAAASLGTPAFELAPINHQVFFPITPEGPKQIPDPAILQTWWSVLQHRIVIHCGAVTCPAKIDQPTQAKFGCFEAFERAAWSRIAAALESFGVPAVQRIIARTPDRDKEMDENFDDCWV
ncbi:hypothetical protein Rhopal_001898-T1 [Rhodotorula paludigena]|uniref:Uncharacterized protein n=1 Tax=Rhodotorula paludigena TaxID=86838 RepID=A0AAV5GIM9_9BASI|nr:hypothetical protein Rhopal_001898-T1 [Rhodotorula paludigena]